MVINNNKKKLQQVTVSTTEKDLSGEQVSKEYLTTNKKYQNDEIFICKTNNVKLDNSDKEKEESMFDLSANEKNFKLSDKKKEENNLPKLNESILVESIKNKISLSGKLNTFKEKIIISSSEINKTINNVKPNIKNMNDMKSIS